MSFNRLFYCKILFSMNTIIIIYTGGITLNLVVYLAGEIHTDWRGEIEEKVKKKVCRLLLSHRKLNMTAQMTLVKRFSESNQVNTIKMMLHLTLTTSAHKYS